MASDFEHVQAELVGIVGQLSLDMLNEAGVVLVPGLDFGPFTARRYIRLSYATSMEKLQEAVARLRVFFDGRRKAA